MNKLVQLKALAIVLCLLSPVRAQEEVLDANDATFKVALEIRSRKNIRLSVIQLVENGNYEIISEFLTRPHKNMNDYVGFWEISNVLTELEYRKAIPDLVTAFNDRRVFYRQPSGEEEAVKSIARATLAKNIISLANLPEDLETPTASTASSSDSIEEKLALIFEEYVRDNFPNEGTTKLSEKKLPKVVESQTIENSNSAVQKKRKSEVIEESVVPAEEKDKKYFLWLLLPVALLIGYLLRLQRCSKPSS